MKIAINCIFFQPIGDGIKQYIYNIVTELSQVDKSNKYVLYVLNDQMAYTKERFPTNMKIKCVPFGSTEVIKRSLCEFRFWGKEERIEMFDVFHSPFFHSPRFKNAKVILTVHDLRFCRYPFTYPILRYIYLKFVVGRSLRRCDKIISISEFTKQELIEIYSIEESKITVIHEALNKNHFSTEIALIDKENLIQNLKTKQFVLTVGRIEPRKNFNRLLLAFRILKREERNRQLNLVIVGQMGHEKHFLKLINEIPDVHYLNYVEQDILIWLYKNAKLFVFPSYYEGFGFPPLEAAYMGLISAVSNVSSIPEICGDSSFYFNPFDVDNIMKTMNEALYDKAQIQNKRNKLQENLQRFSWKNNALETLKLYNSFYKND